MVHYTYTWTSTIGDSNDRIRSGHIHLDEADLYKPVEPQRVGGSNKMYLIHDIVKELFFDIDQRVTLLGDHEDIRNTSSSLISISHKYNPTIAGDEMAVMNAYYLAIIVYLLDRVDDFKVKANIVREAITSLVPRDRVHSEVPSKYIRKGLPALLVFSHKFSIEELSELMYYAGVKHISPVEQEKLEGTCVAGSMIAKINN